MLKINRSSLDKAIKNLDGMFNGTMEVLKEYEAEKKALEERKDALSKLIAEQQEQHAQTFIDRELAKDNPSDYIYMSKQLASMEEELRVLLSLQDQQKDDFYTLKQKYMPIIREAYSKDSAICKAFNVNESIHNVGDELKQAIADYEQAIDKQDKQVMPLIQKDFLGDSELMNESWEDPDRRRNALTFKREFDFARNRLYYDKEIKL
ncbi:hypothetical protein M3599_15370 [Niallia circulans]|uniref:hypothetical protein n=1 Tax=Niallia circulans TaxID=1397 RepID=UPI00203D5A9B|nr:hypothetical protein [Niallia circulans]MCM2982305.1 hypothetical protein [Niallia circulans]